MGAERESENAKRARLALRTAARRARHGEALADYIEGGPGVKAERPTPGRRANRIQPTLH